MGVDSSTFLEVDLPGTVHSPVRSGDDTGWHGQARRPFAVPESEDGKRRLRQSILAIEGSGFPAGM